MSFSRDVPGAETIDKRRELEVRESYELWGGGTGGRSSGKKGGKVGKRRDNEKVRRREKKDNREIEGCTREGAAQDRFPSFKFK